MFLQVFVIIFLVMVFLSLAAFGIVSILNKQSNPPTGNCKSSSPYNEGFNCGCSAGGCIDDKTGMLKRF